MSDLLTGDIPKSPASASKSTGVTYLNKKPLVLIVGTVAVLMAVAGFALQKMAARQNKEVEQSAEGYQAITQDTFVEKYLLDRGDGVIEAKPEPQFEPLPPAFLSEPKDSDLQKVSINPKPRPEPVAPPPRECGSPEDCALLAKITQQASEAIIHERIRLQQLRRTQLETAVTGSMRVNFNRSGDPETGICEGAECREKEEATTPEDPATAAGNLIRTRGTANLDNMLSLLNSRISSAGNAASPAAALPTGGGSPIETLNRLVQPGSGIIPANPGVGALPGGLGVANANRQTEFLSGQGREESDYLEESLQDPRSATELKAGTVIRASLLTGINSDLPGQIIAQVTRNIWDTVSGEYILIPQGARLIGRYDSGISFGQKRLLVAWSRIIYPNGQSLRLNGMQGYDQAGQSGFKDRVNNHYGKVFGSALLFSVVSAGVSKVDDNTDRDPSVFSTESAFREEMAKQISRLSNKYLDAALNIAPTLNIRQGYVMNVMVDKDIVLPPYEQMHRQFVPRYFPKGDNE